MLTKNYIKENFSQIKRTSNLDLTKNLSWGFFFSHSERDTLEVAKKIFMLNGYDFVEVVLDENTFHLHIEKIEVHNSETLYKRCIELYSLAKELSIDNFYGFDVEEVGFR